VTHLAVPRRRPEKCNQLFMSIEIVTFVTGCKCRRKVRNKEQSTSPRTLNRALSSVSTPPFPSFFPLYAIIRGQVGRVTFMTRLIDLRSGSRVFPLFPDAFAYLKYSFSPIRDICVVYYLFLWLREPSILIFYLPLAARPMVDNPTISWNSPFRLDSFPRQC